MQMLQMVQMLVGGAPSEFNTEWVAALAGLFVGQVRVEQPACQHLPVSLACASASCVFNIAGLP